jgi:methyl-accepting chemotaxis protein
MAKAQFDKSTNDLGSIVTELGGNVPALQTSSPTTGGMTTGGTTTTDMTTGTSTSGATTTETPMTGMTSSSQPIPLSSGQESLLINFIDLWTNVHGKAENIFNIPNPVGNQEAINQLKDIEASSQSMAAFAESIHTVLMENVSQSQIQANTIIVKTSVFLIIAIVGAFLLGAFLSRMIGRAISRPMAQLTQISSNISLGDLDTKVDVKGGGEIGELAGAIERMRTSLKIIIDRLSDEEEDLRSWATQLASHELRRKVRGGIITLGGHKYTVGKDLDGQYVYVKLDYDLREIVLTPPSGEIKHLSLSI